MLEHVDSWFLQISVVVLSGYFLWSIKRVLDDFKNQVQGLKDVIRDLFKRGDSFEHRLSTLEGRCNLMHGNHAGGRRDYDPSERPIHE